MQVKPVLLSILSSCLLASCTADVDRLDGPTQAIVGPDGLVYVADGYFNARIVVFAPDGQVLDAWGTKGPGDHQLATPHGIALAGNGTLWVADRDNARLVHYSAEGDLLQIVEGAELGRPWSVAVAPDGVLYVVDGGDQDPDSKRAGIVRLTGQGVVLNRFGAYGTMPGEFIEPHMLALDADSNVYVAAIGAGGIQKFRPDAPCQPDAPCAYTAVPEWSQSALSQGLAPLGVATRGDEVLVSHEGDGEPIWVLSSESGDILGSFAKGTLQRPHGLFVDPAGQLWVADVRANRIVCFGTDGTKVLELGAEL